MAYILSNTEQVIEVQVRPEEVRVGDPLVAAKLSLPLKGLLSAEIYEEQQSFVQSASIAAYTAFNPLDQKQRFKAHVDLIPRGEKSFSVVKGSSSSGLAYSLSIFEAWWEKVLGKTHWVGAPVFATGEVNNNGEIKAIGLVEEKLRHTISFLDKHEIAQSYVCLPKENEQDVPSELLAALSAQGAKILFAARLPELLGELLGEHYDGSPLGRWEPFKGLESFEYRDSMRFFGRKKDVERLYDDLERNRGILIVSGPTGSGKSSLIKAGLIPQLVKTKDNFSWTSITPTSLNRSLFETLLYELFCNLDKQQADRRVKDIFSNISENKQSTITNIAQYIEQQNGNFLFHIDQFEDFFTQSVEQRYLDDLQILHEVTKATEKLTIVLSIRNEYLSILLNFGLITSPVISNVPEHLSPEAWREIVIEQADFSGVDFEREPENLAERIINDATQTTNALPMVEFVLRQLYERSKDDDLNGSCLRIKDYEALGGITGAIAQRAEQAVKSSRASSKTIHHFFSLFVGVTNEGIPYPKQVVFYESIEGNPELQGLIQSLLDSNIVASADSNTQAIIKLTHDSLFYHWERLQIWLNDQENFLDWKNQIDRSFRKWSEAGHSQKNRIYLIRDKRLLRDGVNYINDEIVLDNTLKRYVENSQRYRRNKLVKLALVFFVLPLFVSVLLIWDKNTTRSEYYCAIGKKWEIPFGIEELNAQQMKKKQTRFHFAYQGGFIAKLLGYGNRLLEVRYENNLAYLSPDYDNYARATFSYKQNGRLDSAVLFDHTGKFIEKQSYEFLDNLVTVNYLDQNNNSKKYAGSSSNREKLKYKSSNVIRIVRYFNDNGSVEKEIYQRDGFGNRISDEFGVSGKLFSYSDRGLVKTQTDLYPDSESLIKDYKNGTMTLFQYNSDGLVQRVEFFDEESNPINNELGVSIVEKKYDLFGNVIEEIYFDQDYRPITTANGVAKQLLLYNERGWKVGARYLGLDGEPVEQENGSFSTSIIYTPEGYPKKITYLDENSLPMIIPAGFTSREWSYDENGREIKALTLDFLDQPVIPKDRYYAGYTSKYDLPGNLVEKAYLGSDGLPIKEMAQVARLERILNEHGNLIKEAYYDVAGNHIIDPERGCSIYETTYDSIGNMVLESCLGINQEPLARSYETPIQKYEYDQNGNIIKTIFLDADKKPMLHPIFGASGFESSYDERGYLTRFITLGVNGQPMIDPTLGVAGRESSYDVRGNKTREISLGVDEKPMIDPKAGVAGFESSYDERGNVIKIMTMGVDRKPMVNPKFGSAGFERSYDERGNVIKNVFLGADRKPMIHPELGTAGRENSFDERGNQTRHIFLGVDEKPMINPKDGTAGSVSSYDERGNVIKFMTMGIDRKPMLHPQYGLAGYEKSYDENGNLVKFICLGIDGKLMLSPTGGTAGWERSYDEKGNVVKHLDLGADGKPIVASK